MRTAACCRDRRPRRHGQCDAAFEGDLGAGYSVGNSLVDCLVHGLRRDQHGDRKVQCASVAPIASESAVADASVRQINDQVRSQSRRRRSTSPPRCLLDGCGQRLAATRPTFLQQPSESRLVVGQRRGQGWRSREIWPTATESRGLKASRTRGWRVAAWARRAGRVYAGKMGREGMGVEFAVVVTEPVARQFLGGQRVGGADCGVGETDDGQELGDVVAEDRPRSRGRWRWYEARGVGAMQGHRLEEGGYRVSGKIT